MILHVPAGSPWWIFAAANLILFLHIAGGGVGIISGTFAFLARKGGRLHRTAGTTFFVSMLIMTTIGAAASPFLPVPSMPNVVAGVLTFYLVATGWIAVQRKGGRIGRFEKAGLGVALAVVAAGRSSSSWRGTARPAGSAEHRRKPSSYSRSWERLPPLETSR